MRRIAGFFVGLCCCSVVAAAQSADSFPAATLTGTHWHIEANRLGPIRIGMPINEALQLAAVYTVKRVTKMTEGTRSTVYEVWYDAQLLFLLEPDCHAVWRIDVRSPEFRLGEVDGVGVGTPLARLQRRYPAMRFHAAADGETCGMLTGQPVGVAFCFRNPRPAPADTVDHVRIF